MFCVCGSFLRRKSGRKFRRKSFWFDARSCSQLLGLTMTLGSAVASGDTEEVRRLLSQGCDPDAIDAKGRPPLLVAVRRQDVVMVRLLLRCGASVVATNVQGETALHVAVTTTSVSRDIVVALTEAGADPDIPEKLSGNTPLHYLCSRSDCHNDVLELLAHHATVNVRNVSGRTPLHQLVLADADDSVIRDRVAILLDAGAIPDVQDECRDTPLHLAVHRGFCDTVQCLLHFGHANANVVDRYLQTPLHVAAARNIPNVVSILLRKQSNCDTNLKDLNGDTPLHLAAGKGHDQVVRLLLSRDDVDVGVTNNHGLLPLHNAIESGFVSVVQELLNANCDLLAGGDQTPLDLACTSDVGRSRPEISILLLRTVQEMVDNCGLESETAV